VQKDFGAIKKDKRTTTGEPPFSFPAGTHTVIEREREKKYLLLPVVEGEDIIFHPKSPIEAYLTQTH
jgi:hypothetical protein